LIELMIAIGVIFVGFGAILAMILSSVSNMNSSKAKLKASAVSQGILEKFRNKRDKNGIASLLSYSQDAIPDQTIDGTKYSSVAHVYYLDGKSALVEATVSWVFKKQEILRDYILLTNYNNSFPTVMPTYYTTPSWLNPIATMTPLPPTATLTPTPIPPYYTCKKYRYSSILPGANCFFCPRDAFASAGVCDVAQCVWDIGTLQYSTLLACQAVCQNDLHCTNCAQGSAICVLH